MSPCGHGRAEGECGQGQFCHLLCQELAADGISPGGVHKDLFFFFFLVLYKRECSRGNGNQWELRAQRSFGRDLVISPVQRDCM